MAPLPQIRVGDALHGLEHAVIHHKPVDAPPPPLRGLHGPRPCIVLGDIQAEEFEPLRDKPLHLLEAAAPARHGQDVDVQVQQVLYDGEADAWARVLDLSVGARGDIACAMAGTARRIGRTSRCASDDVYVEIIWRVVLHRGRLGPRCRVTLYCTVLF